MELEIELTSTATQCVASAWGWYPCTYGILLYYYMLDGARLHVWGVMASVDPVGTIFDTFLTPF